MSPDRRRGLGIGPTICHRIAFIAPTVDAFRALPDRAILSIYCVGAVKAGHIIAARDTWDDDEIMATFDLLPSGWTSAVGTPPGWRPNWVIDGQIGAANWVGEGMPS
jgi:hypothetical protein